MRTIFDRVYRDRKVLITGHTGFKGSWLSVWLGLLGARVIGYALPPPTQPSLFELLGLNQRLLSIEGDVRDKRHLEQVVKQHQPDMVFHLAAQPIVRLSYECPHLTYETNIMGTVNLLEAVRNTNSVRVGLIITSDKCYENQEWLYAYRENAPLGGYDPYSSSKAGAELVAGCYQRSFFNPERYNEHRMALATARAGNVIGGGDWAADRIVPDAVRALSAGKPIVIRNPLAVRPWQHVLDPLAGYLWLAAKMWSEGNSYSSAWNFGPDNHENLSVGQLADNIVKNWGSGEWQSDSGDQSRLHEANNLILDCSKARALLDWTPVYKVDEALDKTVEWYKAYYFDSKQDIYDLTWNQVQAYVKRARELGLRWAGEVDGDEL
ncbi:MAG: CDP-glucose 4,6-dehydratase [Syntrophomonadaceae bacterium]|nr:CDP-glucose 4,6-dehydratase [Syntrophomonadaceae bacterium]